MRDGAVPLNDADLAELFVDYAVGAALMEVREVMDERGQSELGDWLADAMNSSGAFEGVEQRLATSVRETVKAYGDRHGIPERRVRPAGLVRCGPPICCPTRSREGRRPRR